MVISSRLNRLLRGVIREFRDQLVKGVDDGDKITPAIVKTMLCYNSDEFPRDELGIPLSFTKIDNKQACALIEFIFREGGNRGFTFDIIEREWRELLKG